ncbi:hypothetical protein IAU59_006989 [Kwoniella sp. CBS 9459]
MPARVMSQLENTSAILGEYMLKGWTLTDLHCSQCRSTPLMREPNAIAERENRDRIQFCALCDGRPEGRASASSGPRQTSFQTGPTLTTQDAAAEVEASFASSSSSAAGVAEAASLPNPADDAASSISSLLLQGYSLLGDNCPVPTCRGIPLVGYPRKADGSKDGRRMCVCCGGRWVEEAAVESQGMKVFRVESPRSKARRELYDKDKGKGKSKGKSRVMDPEEFEAHANESAKRLHAGPGPAATAAASDLRQHPDEDFGTDIEMDDDDEEPATQEVRSAPAIAKSSAAHILPIRPTPYKPSPPSPSSALGQSLSHTSDSLSQTLKSLSTSLERYAARSPVPPTSVHSARPVPGGPDEENGRWFVDLKLHTEAIKDVLGVLGQVERARRVGY